MKNHLVRFDSIFRFYLKKTIGMKQSRGQYFLLIEKMVMQTIWRIVQQIWLRYDADNFYIFLQKEIKLKTRYISVGLKDFLFFFIYV